MEYYAVEAVQDGTAVLMGDNGEKLFLPCGSLQGSCKAGDIFYRCGDTFARDDAERDRRAQKMQTLFAKLTQK